MRTELVTFLGRERSLNLGCVGAYEPWLDSHAALLSQLRATADQNNLGLAVVLLYPHPASFLPGNSKRFSNPEPLTEKVDRLRAAGANTVLVVGFEEEDMEMNAYEFLNRVRSQLNLHSLFIGARQSLGTGPLGGSEALRDYCRKSGLGLYFLKGHNKKGELENPNYVRQSY